MERKNGIVLKQEDFLDSEKLRFGAYSHLEYDDRYHTSSLNLNRQKFAQYWFSFVIIKNEQGIALHLFNQKKS